MKVKVSPFLVPPSTEIVFDGWYQQLGDQEVPLPDELEHWDYQTRLVLSGFITLNEVSVLTQCQLGPESRLGILVTAYSEATSTETLLTLVDVPSGWVGARALTVEIPGQHFARRLTVETQVVVTHAQPKGRISAVRPGSILWTSRQKTYLQGIGSQFPTYAEDFSVTRPKIQHAGWLIEIETADPHALFLSNIKVVLNSGRLEIQKLLNGTKDAATIQLGKILDIDVTRRVAIAALSMPEMFLLDTDFDDLSVVGGLRASLDLLWPGVDLEVLLHEYNDDLGAFEARIQENRRLLR